jgi:hypothetical protein
MTDYGLLLDFFLRFARFEYALKNTGFYKKHRRKNGLPIQAEPDWDRFAARELRAVFDPHRTPELSEAFDYLTLSPPRKQVIFDRAPAWETSTRDPLWSDAEFALRMVRCVRNNLFHGAKHTNTAHESPERTARLLRSSLTILDECLVLAPSQKAAFEEATL